jgi:hypothetical protein
LQHTVEIDPWFSSTLPIGVEGAVSAQVPLPEIVALA